MKYKNIIAATLMTILAAYTLFPRIKLEDKNFDGVYDKKISSNIFGKYYESFDSDQDYLFDTKISYGLFKKEKTEIVNEEISKLIRATVNNATGCHFTLDPNLKNYVDQINITTPDKEIVLINNKGVMNLNVIYKGDTIRFYNSKANIPNAVIDKTLAEYLPMKRVD